MYIPVKFIMLLNITIAGQGLQLQACWSALLALSRKGNYCINPDVMKALGMCGLISRTNLFIPFVRRPKVLNNLYSPTPNRLFSFYLVGAFRPTREFFTHMETSLLPVKDVIFDLCLKLMAIHHWGFLSVSHLVWLEASVYNGYLWGPMTLTLIAERLAAGLSLPVFTT